MSCHPDSNTLATSKSLKTRAIPNRIFAIPSQIRERINVPPLANFVKSREDCESGMCATQCFEELTNWRFQCIWKRDKSVLRLLDQICTALADGSEMEVFEMRFPALRRFVDSKNSESTRTNGIRNMELSQE